VPYETHNNIALAKRVAQVYLMHVHFLCRKEQCCPPKCRYGYWIWK